MRQYIRFDTLIKRIYKRGDSWFVQSTSVQSSPTAAIHRQARTATPSNSNGYSNGHIEKDGVEDQPEQYDAICDCSGHYTRPYVPYLQGLWLYKRRIVHAKWYRGPEAFSGQVRSTRTSLVLSTLKLL